MRVRREEGRREGGRRGRRREEGAEEGGREERREVLLCAYAEALSDPRSTHALGLSSAPEYRAPATNHMFSG